jgi:hypothetical protein
MSLSLSAFLLTYPSLCLPTSLSLSFHLSSYPSIYLSIRPFPSPSIYLPSYLRMAVLSLCVCLLAQYLNTSPQPFQIHYNVQTDATPYPEVKSTVTQVMT